jgi:acyl-CoA synthetase (AMP-forming)/AMP-acid ligase II
MSIDRLPPTVGHSLEMALASDPQRTAVVGSDRRLTYAELDEAAEIAATALYDWGLRRGDRLAVSLPNTTYIVVLFHAAMRLGAIWVGLNTNLAPPEKHFMLNDSAATLLLASSEVLAGLGEEMLEGLVVKNIPCDLVESESIAQQGIYPRPTDLFDAPAGIAYTSGTTGRPKGVIHSHRNLLLPGAVLVAERGYDSSLRRGDCAALTILNLQVTSTLLAAQAGGTQIVMDRVDPLGIAGWIEGEQINSWFGVPTMLHGLASNEEVAARQLASLEDIWTGGADLPESIRESFEHKFGRRVHATYGMTEIPTVVAIEARHEVHRPGSSGRVLPHLEVEIVDADGMTVEGEEGEIVVRGSTTGEWANTYRPMLGYHNGAAVADHFDGQSRLRTGDLGLLDEDACLHLKGRRTSLILRGGSNVYPAEVERVILEVPGVTGVSVVGYPDERLGQRVAAAIELESGSAVDEEQLLEHCKSCLARYKLPQRWLFRPLPRNAMGKVVRPEVEAWFQ